MHTLTCFTDIIIHKIFVWFFFWVKIMFVLALICICVIGFSFASASSKRCQCISMRLSILWTLLDFCKAMVNSKIQNTFFTIYWAQNYRTIIRLLLFVSISPKKIQQILSERKTWYRMNLITTKFSILQPLVRNWNFQSKATLHKYFFSS